MKKAQTEYYFTKDDTMLTIKINQDCENLGYNAIWIEDSNSWKQWEKAIEHYEWIIKCIKELEKEEKL